MKTMFKKLIIAFVILMVAVSVGFTTIEEYRVIAFIVAVIVLLYINLITDEIDKLMP